MPPLLLRISLSSRPAMPSSASSRLYAESLEDFEHDTQREQRLLGARPGFVGYLLRCLVFSLLLAAASIGLWSEMGCGSVCLVFLQEHSDFANYFAAIAAGVLVLLYLFDFFYPPREPSSSVPQVYFAFRQHKVLGRLLLMVALAAFVAAGALLAKSYPFLPLVITIFVCPFSVIWVRIATLPTQLAPLEQAIESPLSSTESSFKNRMKKLKIVAGEEDDDRHFYVAATTAFMFTCLVSVVAWLPWCFSEAGRLDLQAIKDQDDLEMAFVRWSVPLIVAFLNVVFASITGLRVALNRVYSATNETKNNLIVCKGSAIDTELMKVRIAMLTEMLETAAAKAEGGAPNSVLFLTQDTRQQCLVQHIVHMRQLQSVVKFVGLVLVALFASLYAAFQLTLANSHIARMVQSFLLCVIFTFLAFVYVSFGRLWQSIQLWLKDLPLWKSAMGVGQHSALRAFGMIVASPLVPVVLLLSWLNMRLRILRGATTVCGAKRTWLTPRVQAAVEGMRTWEWVQIVWWGYAVSGLLVCYQMLPVLLNVFLAWMVGAMASLPFFMILVATYASGMFLFLLPPIPGPPIYLFGGIVISNRSPGGFGWGCVATISLCFVLKLSACAVQQKLIGVRLGDSLAVRQKVGVHKPFIRAIQAVISQPGLNFGKCMILCGGPDWPVSVLAGILRLSLAQCLLGTCPIIVSLIPFCLTGSFFLKKDEGDVWNRAADLMIILTALVTVVFWIGLSWAIQEQFDKHSAELTMPKAEFVELDWLDFRTEEIAKACALTWEDLPKQVQVFYVGGATIVSVVGVLFVWRASWCLGKFNVTDDIKGIRWLGPEGIIRWVGVVGLLVAAFGYTGLIVYKGWRDHRNRSFAQEAAASLAHQEAAWKEKRLIAAQEALKSDASTPQFVCASTFFGATATPDSRVPLASETFILDISSPVQSDCSLPAHATQADVDIVIQDGDSAGSQVGGVLNLRWLLPALPADDHQFEDNTLGEGFSSGRCCTSSRTDSLCTLCDGDPKQ